MTSSPAHEPIKAYWQPGCTSCLRMKEFLTRHGVPFVSVNVLADADAFAELARLGVRSVPIVQRGSDWANGQVLRDVARVAGIPWGGAPMLPVDVLFARLMAIQATAHRLFAQIPAARIAEQLPDRPRSYGQLAYHIFNIADAWLEHEVDGQPLLEGAYDRVAPAGQDSQADVLAYGARVATRLQDWWTTSGTATDYGRRANVYYGEVNLHEYLERTAWHSGQHLRQLVMVLGLLGIEADRPPGPELFEGLPMPQQAWDPERKAG